MGRQKFQSFEKPYLKYFNNSIVFLWHARAVIDKDILANLQNISDEYTTFLSYISLPN